MKNIKYILSILTVSLFLNSCTEDFDSINTDKKNLLTSEIATADVALIAKGSFYGATYVGAPSNPGRNAGPFQLIHSLFPDVYSNYFATTAANFGSDQFELVGRWLNGGYNYNYYNVAPELKFALDYSAENNLEVENAMMKVWKVYFYHRITDLWGPIPYSQFGKQESGPIAFDSQQEIYNDFFKLLDESVAVLKANSGSSSFFGVPSADVIYGGSTDKWLKMANSLRLRLAIRVKYADAALSKNEAEKAVSDGVIESNSDNAAIHSDGPNFINPYNVITGWGEFRMSADMESILKGYQDPRAAQYFSEAVTPDPTDDPAGVTFNFEGMRNGQTKSQKQGTSFNTIASDMAAPYTERGAIGPDMPVIRAAEVYFLRAEGALEGWAMGGTAQELYESGITASHLEYGLDGNDLSGNDYVSSANVPAALDASTPAVSTVPIAFDTAGTKERQLEQIITQKWIALYPNSEDAYADRRRTGYPTLYDRLNSLNPNIGVNEIPRRMPWVSSEYDNNGEAVQSALGLPEMSGGDNGTTKVWWDKK
ncbi:SusD/RagB family nutrient-binding outer membrane lipoprotein [Gelatiniphilus marinus]|uniref:SusD/RagB family nutrient-binding outer membrane lipoprotein n=1 Tax=Gelatiniphilus marinus TaxID=1759464 RepID=A0ABW5JRQ5_9FLAO